jgi:hypothetical protein
MKIHSVDDIEKLMQLSDEIQIANDGWADISFKPSFEELKGPMYVESILLSTYRMEFGAQFTRSYGCSPEEAQHHKRETAHAIHREIYGDLIPELHLLKHKMEYSPKSEAEAILDGIIRALGRN